jgi:Amt family ammonium transporter
MIEFSSSRRKFSSFLIVKNLLQFAVVIVSLWVLGFGFLAGNTKSEFVGETLFGGKSWLDSSGSDGIHFFYMSNLLTFIVFIVNGSISERASYATYVLIPGCLGIFIWPAVVAWTYGGGWLSSEMPDSMIELGSAVVYTFAGAVAVVGAVITGRRPGRFGIMRDQIKINDFPLYVFGCLFTVLGCQGVAFYYSDYDGMSWANIWICGSVSSVTALKLITLLSTDLSRHYIAIYQGFIAGIVFITSASNNIKPWESGLYGLMSGAVFSVSFVIFNKIELDDMIYAGPTFLFPGIFGGILPGFNDDKHGVYWGGWESGQTLGANVVGTVTIFFWAVFWAILIFGTLRIFDFINLPVALQEDGLEGRAEVRQSGFQLIQIKKDEREISLN